MKRISSKMTVFWKRIFPALRFGFFALFFLFGGEVVFTEGRGQLGFLIIPFVMTGFGYLMMRTLLFDLMDEVWNDVDALVIRNRGKEERLPFSEISEVSTMMWINPPRVTLRLRKPGLFGRDVPFSPLKRIIPFLTHPSIEDLIGHVEVARRGTWG